jgi:hypothetical protein
MASIRDNIKFDPKGIGTVLNHSRLRVPLNQREYAWEEDHVRELFQDFAGAIDSDKTYFLGTIVLTKGSDDVPEVTDGQQRLATTAVLLAAIRDWFHWQGEADHAISIETDYLQRFDRADNGVLPRLRLNVDDHDFFERRVLARPDNPARRSAKPIKQSHELIQQAAEIAAEHVRHILELHGSVSPENELSKRNRSGHRYLVCFSHWDRMISSSRTFTIC